MIVVLVSPTYDPASQVFGVFQDRDRAIQAVKAYDLYVTDWAHSSGYEFCYSINHTFKLVQVELNRVMVS